VIRMGADAHRESNPAAEDKVAKPNESIKAVAVGTVGNVLEWFDFGVYGYFAPYIGKLFFPRTDPLASLMSAFAVFAVGALSRPLGAVVFGWIGDRKGRRTSLMATVFLMAGATFLIGVLPTYSQLGMLAPALLILARLLQGLSCGGEWGGSAAFMVEYAAPNQRGVTGSFQQVSTGAGFFLGSLFGLIVTSTMTQETILAWAWRLPFLSGIVLGAVGLYMRSQLEDTPQFRMLKQRGQRSAAPVREALGSQWTGITVAFGYNVIQSVGYSTMLTFMPSFTSEVLKLPPNQSYLSNSIQLLVFVLLLPVMGTVSDRIGRKSMLVTPCLFLMLATYPIFRFIVRGGLPTLIFCQLIFGVVLAAYCGPAVAATVELFPTKVRYTSVSIGFNLAVALIGMTSPMISTRLISLLRTPMAPSYVIIGASAISLVTVLLGCKETAFEPLKA
jgi:MFS transporter, MHS family, proline/betaine transporter